MTQGASGKKLTDCPSNLKEAIDWILRVTGKDTVSSGDNNGTAGLAKAVQELLNTAGVTQLKPEITIEQTLIENLAGGLAMFIGYGDNGQIKGTGIAVGQNGQIGKPWENRENATDKTYGGYNKGYIWSYPRGATWRHQWDTPSDSGAQTCAKIFLGCVPMLFYGLGLLYWRCRTNGEWNSLQLNETALYGKELCYYMCSQGFVRSELKGDKKTGSYVVSSALNTFSELNEAVAGSNSLIEYLRNLNSKFNEALKVDSSQIADTLKQHPLSALFLCASAYFTHHRSAKSAKTATSPSTIRHMLYWLSGLTITPQFGDLLKHIDTVVPADFKVAVSGSPKTDETLTADDMMGHLITACLSASWVLDTIQGPGDPDKPLLHEIFSNTEHLQYTSLASSLFYTLSSYTYALQFQLTFLVRQCRFSYDDACGWQQCKYGGSYTRGVTVHSYLCPSNGNGCDNTNSPLQAFLTDNLKGFSRNIPGNAGHLATCSGSYCHTPMGFNGHLRSDKKTGENIYDNLSYFCGDSKDPLRQLCEKLSCLTKRTPRNLGDLFGFLSKLSGQAFSNLEIQNSLRLAVSSSTQASKRIEEFITSLKTPSSLLTDSLSTLTNQVTFWETLDGYFAVSSLASGLYNLNQHCHEETKDAYGTKFTHDSKCSSFGHSETSDLMSLYYARCTPSNTNCGPYLNPLVYSSGATFSPKYSYTYLSWLLYLHDDFYDWFQRQLDDLKNVKCPSNSIGTHATGCSCPSVVQCSQVLPLLYSRGFNFYSASWLKSKKVMCQTFHDQLKAVAEGKPINDLLTIIDDFLYIFRYSFLHKVSACWTIYICLILYTFLYYIDAIKLLSFPLKSSSHSIAPAALLTSGKPLPITKLTYITQ